MIRLISKLELMTPTGRIEGYGNYFYINNDTIEEYEKVIIEIGKWAHKTYLSHNGQIGKCITTYPNGKKYDNFNFNFSCK